MKKQINPNTKPIAMRLTRNQSQTIQRCHGVQTDSASACSQPLAASIVTAVPDPFLMKSNMKTLAK
jgi:hypothetical protein